MCRSIRCWECHGRCKKCLGSRRCPEQHAATFLRLLWSELNSRCRALLLEASRERWHAWFSLIVRSLGHLRALLVQIHEFSQFTKHFLVDKGAASFIGKHCSRLVWRVFRKSKGHSFNFILACDRCSVSKKHSCRGTSFDVPFVVLLLKSMLPNERLFLDFFMIALHEHLALIIIRIYTHVMILPDSIFPCSISNTVNSWIIPLLSIVLSLCWLFGGGKACDKVGSPINDGARRSLR